MKINSFEIENVKRVRAISYEPTPDGLTVIGGKNGQGKTSILDAIAWALGGAKYAPDNPQRDGSALPPHIKVVLDNGIVVERKGKNSELTVTDPTGARAGQKLLDSLIEQLALDLPKFLQCSDKEKAEVLLRTLGVAEDLARLDREYEVLYNKRHTVGQIAQQKQKYYEGLPSYPDAPEEPVNAMQLVWKNQEILKQNSENDRIRDRLRQKKEDLERIDTEMNQLSAQLQEKVNAYNALKDEICVEQKRVDELVDLPTDEIEEQLAELDAVNSKVAANQSKKHAQEEAEDYKKQYEDLNQQIDDTRRARIELLEHSDLPLEGLGIDNGCLTYKGKGWNCMSGSDQLIVATSIVRKLNPQCQFVLMDKLEQLDSDTLEGFDAWLKAQGLQVIGTRVSTGNECQIVIEDGLIKEQQPIKDWKGATWK